MTNTQQAKMTGYKGLKEFLELPANITIYEGNVPFNTGAGDFATDNAENLRLASVVTADSSGFSTQKKAAKLDMGELGIIIGGAAFGRFNKIGKQSLAEQMHYNITDYTDPADATSAALARAAHKVMNDNIADLTDFVSPAQLLAFMNAIIKFEKTTGTSSSAHKATPTERILFKKSFKTVDATIESQKLYALFFKKDHNEFYVNFMALAEMPTVNIHHTDISTHITNLADGTPIENATITETRTEKAESSDYEGNATIEEVSAGKNVIDITAPGKKTVSLHINVKSGKDNHFNIQMENL